MQNEATNKVIKRDSLKKSSLFNIVIKLLTYLIPLVLSPYLYRTLTFTGVGTFTFQSAYVAYFTLIATFGFNEYGTKRISTATEDPKELNRRFWSIFFSKQILGLACLLVYFTMVATHVFGDSSNDISYYVLSLNIVATMLDITFLYQGVEKFKSISLRTAFIKIINLVLIFVFVKKPEDYLIYVWIMTTSTVLSSVIMFLPLHKYVGKPSMEYKAFFLDIKGAFAFFVSALAISLYTTIDSTILGLLTDQTQVGYFSSAIKIKEIVTSISFAIVPIIFSRVSYLVSIKKEVEARELTYKTFNIILDFSIPCMFGIICVANVFMPLYFGADAINAVTMLIISSVSLPLISMSLIINNAYFLPKNKITTANMIYISAAIFNLVVAYLFINLFGPNGIAVAMVATELFVAILCMYYSSKDIDYKRVLKTVLKPFDAALIMATIYFVLNNIIAPRIGNNLSMVILIGLSIIIYPSFLFLFKDDFFNNLIKKYLAKTNWKFINNRK